MKKFALAAALVALTASASAAVTGFATLDYDRANDGQALRSQYEGAVGLAATTAYGTFDGAILGRQLNGKLRDDNAGFEVGYTNGIKLGSITLKGRAAYGRLNQVDTKTAGFKGNSEFYSLAAEASVPVTSNVSAFVGYRHRNALETGTPTAANRITVGADVGLTKDIAVRVGYAHTTQAGLQFNGVTTAVNYKF